MVVFIEEGGCQRVNEGWKGLSCLMCMPAMPCPLLLKKKKKKSGPGPAGIQALGLKVGVPA
jgi:hypothetical protein